jgi:hypothetical protein
MTLGAICGAAAAIPLVLLSGSNELSLFASCVLAGAVAGYGITFGLTHVTDKTRQAAIDAVTAACAVGAASLPGLVIRTGRLTERHVAIAAAALVPVLLVATVFKQWPSVREELRQEAVLGLITAEEASHAAHPLRRFGRGGWHDAQAHREFVCHTYGFTEATAARPSRRHGAPLPAGGHQTAHADAGDERDRRPDARRHGRPGLALLSPLQCIHE